MERIKRLKLSIKTHKLSLNINAYDGYKKKITIRPRYKLQKTTKFINMTFEYKIPMNYERVTYMTYKRNLEKSPRIIRTPVNSNSFLQSRVVRINEGLLYIIFFGVGN